MPKYTVEQLKSIIEACRIWDTELFVKSKSGISILLDPHTCGVSVYDTNMFIGHPGRDIRSTIQCPVADIVDCRISTNVNMNPPAQKIDEIYVDTDKKTVTVPHDWSVVNLKPTMTRAEFNAKIVEKILPRSCPFPRHLFEETKKVFGVSLNDGDFNPLQKLSSGFPIWGPYLEVLATKIDITD